MPKAKRSKPKLPPHVVLKNGNWHAKVEFPTPARRPNGTIIYQQMTRKIVPETWDRAAAVIAQLRNMKNEETALAPIVREDVGAILSHYLSVKKLTVSVRTWGYYNWLFEKYIKPSNFAKSDPKQITSLDVQKFYNSLNGSPTMIRKLNVFLSMAFKQAVIWKQIPNNPCLGVMLPKAARIESAALTKSEVKRLITAAKKDDKHIIFEFALETGLRPQETFGLSWKSVDLEKRKIKVEQACLEVFGGGGCTIGPCKTKASYRTIGISEYLADRLRRQREILDESLGADKTLAGLPDEDPNTALSRRRMQQRDNARERLAEMKRFDLVFPAQNGRPRSSHNLNRRDFADLLKAAKITHPYSFRNLRHTCLTMLAEHLTPRLLQSFAGHSDVTTTYRYYTHVQEASEFQAANSMDAILRS